MLKKLILLAMAVTAITAFAIPAMANANELTMPAGTMVKKGAPITLTANGTLITTTELGTLECAKIDIPGEVTESTTTSFAGKGTGGTASGCTVGGEPLSITAPTVTSISSPASTPTAGTVSLSFIADLGVECKFSGTGSFSYKNGADEVTLAETKLTSPLCGTAHIHGTTTIETPPAQGGGSVILD